MSLDPLVGAASGDGGYGEIYRAIVEHTAIDVTCVALQVPRDVLVRIGRICKVLLLEHHRGEGYRKRRTRSRSERHQIQFVPRVEVVSLGLEWVVSAVAKTQNLAISARWNTAAILDRNIKLIAIQAGRRNEQINIGVRRARLAGGQNPGEGFFELPHK